MTPRVRGGRGGRLAPVLAVTLLLGVACSTSGHFVRTGPPHPPRPDNCEIDFFMGGGRPTRPYVPIARIDVLLKGANWFPPSMDDVVTELRKQACFAGAEAVIDIETTGGSQTESSTLRAQATAVRWR